jgi:hypothetical protein
MSTTDLGNEMGLSFPQTAGIVAMEQWDKIVPSLVTVMTSKVPISRFSLEFRLSDDDIG